MVFHPENISPPKFRSLSCSVNRVLTKTAFFADIDVYPDVIVIARLDLVEKFKLFFRN